MKISIKILKLLTILIFYYLLSCQKSDNNSSNALTESTVGAQEVLYVGMNKKTAIILLNKYFDNVNTKRSLLIVDDEGVMSQSTDATNLSWRSKSKKFCLELQWNDDSIYSIGVAEADVIRKRKDERSYLAVQKVSFENDGKTTIFEMR